MSDRHGELQGSLQAECVTVAGQEASVAQTSGISLMTSGSKFNGLLFWV